MDVSRYVDPALVAIAGWAIIAAGGLVSGSKPLIERWLPATDVAHDYVIRALACAYGVVAVLIGVFLFDAFKSPQQAVFDILVGIGVGLGSIGNYWLLTFLVGPLTPVKSKQGSD